MEQGFQKNSIQMAEETEQEILQPAEIQVEKENFGDGEDRQKQQIQNSNEHNDPTAVPVGLPSCSKLGTCQQSGQNKQNEKREVQLPQQQSTEKQNEEQNKATLTKNEISSNNNKHSQGLCLYMCLICVRMCFCEWAHGCACVCACKCAIFAFV